jgi:hypothetical protein
MLLLQDVKFEEHDYSRFYMLRYMRGHLAAVFIHTFSSQVTILLQIYLNFIQNLDYVHDENISSPSQCRIESSSNLSGRSLRNTMLRSRTFSEGKLRYNKR